MAKMKQCPSCGSERIKINGVVQKKKGVFYYLSGAAISDSGAKHGYKLAKGLKGDKSPNAECLDCHHQWVEE